MEKPIIFDAKDQNLKDIEGKYQINLKVDTYREQLDDLFLIRNPHYRFNKNYQADFEVFVKEHSGGRSLEQCGKWIYFPWNKILVHYLEDKAHQEVRTARNRNLISKDEQEKFYNFNIGVTGLSVGSHGAITTALMGGGRVLKLADPDVISPSNLNRMRFDFSQVGVNKAELVAQYVYQLDPYADVQLYTEGINEKNLEAFLDGLDILVEELDDIEMKVKIREEAKKRKIPVIMATDNGDNVILDVERFDLNPELPIFHGALEGFDVQEVKKSQKKMFEAMSKIIDISLVPPRVLSSVMEVGRTIYSWPQLASAATLSGAVIAYAIRKIALGENIKAGKLEVNLDATFDADYEKNEDFRKRELEKFLKAVGQM
jgi:molybdopterin/thiamine biosynthesis adenylyltransferase